MALGQGPWHKLDLLVVALPLALLARFLNLPAAVVFVVSALAVIPLAGLVGRATEVLADSAGPSIGALLNATFGNAAELILAALLVINGEIGLLKASLTGSLIGNLLLLLGVSMIIAGHDRAEVPLPRSSRLQATILFLAIGIFLLPTVFSYRAESSQHRVDEVSDAVALVLVAVYALSLLFMLRTHRSLFRVQAELTQPGEPAAEPEQPRKGEAGGWSPKAAGSVLAGATALVAVAAELVVGSVQEAGAGLGLHTGFLGLIVLPLIGNAAEQFSALNLAAHDRLGVAADIAIGASMQLVMLVVPVLVLVGLISGHAVTLTFSPLELAALVVGTLLVRQVVEDGKANWFEGVMLLGLYGSFATAAFFVDV